jgi:hypothetical protein
VNPHPVPKRVSAQIRIPCPREVRVNPHPVPKRVSAQIRIP